MVFVGMMGAGKSRVGQDVAQRIGLRFLDTDRELEIATGKSVGEIFSSEGEQAFRSMETAMIKSLMAGSPVVLSVGGGAFQSAGNRMLINRFGTSIWIAADLETLWERIKDNNKRPLLQVENPRDVLERLYLDRLANYAKAHIRVNSSNELSVQQMGRKVVGVLAETPGSGVRVKRQ